MTREQVRAEVFAMLRDERRWLTQELRRIAMERAQTEELQEALLDLALTLAHGRADG